MFDDVVLSQGRATNTLAAALLRPVEIGLSALGVATSGDGDNDVLLGDQIFGRYVTVVRDDLGTPLIAELLRQLS
jgi:hypothetical protein